MASSVWSGYLSFGLISMPVKLFSGARGSRVSFHMLHRDDTTRIKQQLYCPNDDRVVERNEIVKGFEYRKGEYVVIEPEEIRKIEPKTAKAMEILQFVKQEEVDPIYFESSYYLMPDEAGKRPYLLLTKAMEESGYLGIAKLTMHNREYTVILRPKTHGLVLHTMYYADEIREVEGFGEGKAELKPGEIKVANQLIEALADKFDPEKFHDTYEENLKAMIKARLEGREVTAVEKPGKPAPVVDLMDALKQSLAQMGKKGGKGTVSESGNANRIHAVAKKKPARATAGPKGKRTA
jgi:DNA end-binding protein Ku